MLLLLAFLVLLFLLAPLSFLAFLFLFAPPPRAVVCIPAFGVPSAFGVPAVFGSGVLAFACGTENFFCCYRTFGLSNIGIKETIL